MTFGTHCFAFELWPLQMSEIEDMPFWTFYLFFISNINLPVIFLLTQILQHIWQVKFKTKDGDEVYFNEKGDPPAKYEIINWQPKGEGAVDFVTVGLYDASLPADRQLSWHNASIIWAKNSPQVRCDPLKCCISMFRVDFPNHRNI